MFSPHILNKKKYLYRVVMCVLMSLCFLMLVCTADLENGIKNAPKPYLDDGNDEKRVLKLDL